MSSNDDDILIQNYLSGDDRAFDDLYQRYRRRLFSWLVKCVQDRRLAEELFQETFLRIIRFLPQYKPQEKFSHLLFRVAHRLVLDAVRKNKKDRGVLSLMDVTEPAAKSESQGLEEAIQRIPKEQRAVIFLSEYAGFTFSEIARITGCSINTALGRMRYGLLNLRKILKEWEAI
ncbi:MAG: sigma-70 family RNA polymerase sigma factor [Armatimonadetes bacterium]|nr:sigma-70 family RNA polymerase sigma factor [Armatimonadota bacterium]